MPHGEGYDDSRRYLVPTPSLCSTRANLARPVRAFLFWGACPTGGARAGGAFSARRRVGTPSLAAVSAGSARACRGPSFGIGSYGQPARPIADCSCRCPSVTLVTIASSARREGGLFLRCARTYAFPARRPTERAVRTGPNGLSTLPSFLTRIAPWPPTPKTIPSTPFPMNSPARQEICRHRASRPANRFRRLQHPHRSPVWHRPPARTPTPARSRTKPQTR